MHRLGDVPVGEASVAIAAASPHRDAAFDAARTALERLKRETPIWKHESYADGSFGLARRGAAETRLQAPPPSRRHVSSRRPDQSSLETAPQLHGVGAGVEPAAEAALELGPAGAQTI